MVTKEENWLELYERYTAHMQSPRIFHRWCAIAVLGHALGRKVWLPCLGGMFNVYPGQLMVVVVSPSATAKKTTVVNTAKRFLVEAPEGSVRLLPKKLSPQQLFKSLEMVDEDGNQMVDEEGEPVPSCGLITAGELGTFFTSEPFAEALATHINDFNDAAPGWTRAEFRSWKVDLWKVCVGLVGGITPKGIAAELPAAARTAGFFGRVIWVWHDGATKARSLLDGQVDLVEYRERLQQILVKRVLPMRGKYKMTKQAKELFNGWFYNVHHPYIQMMSTTDAARDTGYWGRKDSHVLRVAMVLSAAESAELVIRERHVEAALDGLREIERGFPMAFAKLGVSPQQEFEERLLSALDEIGGKATKERASGRWVPEHLLMKKLWMHGGKERFEAAVRTLVTAREIEKTGVGQQASYRRVWSQGQLVRLATEERHHDDEEGKVGKGVSGRGSAVGKRRSGGTGSRYRGRGGRQGDRGGDSGAVAAKRKEGRDHQGDVDSAESDHGGE